MVTGRYLIDGNNLLHAVRAGESGRAIGRETLCRILGEWTAGHPAEVTVVFDGPAPRGGLARQMSRPGLEVRFSGPRSADAVIEDEVARASAAGSITVITSDRAIRHAVRYRRARCISSEDFVAQLQHQPDDTTTEPVEPPEKPPELSADETRQWLNEFGPVLEGPFDDAEMLG